MDGEQRLYDVSRSIYKCLWGAMMQQSDSMALQKVWVFKAAGFVDTFLDPECFCRSAFVGVSLFPPAFNVVP